MPTDRGSIAEREQRFLAHRRLLFGIAYRMLGTVGDAEDIVQEAFLRWIQVDDTTVRCPRSYLIAIVTRLALDILRSARIQRETYVGPWLPEPIVIDTLPDVADQVVRDETLTLAFLTALECLSPVERAVLLLHDVVEVPFAEISEMVGKSPAHCRQIARRARTRLADATPRLDPPAPDQWNLVERFVRAITNGETDTLIALLAADATLWADGGETVAAALHPIEGACRIAGFLINLARHDRRQLEPHVAWVNGQPGIIIVAHGEVAAVLVLDVVAGQINGLRNVLHPAKLTAARRWLGLASGKANGNATLASSGLRQSVRGDATAHAPGIWLPPLSRASG